MRDLWNMERYLITREQLENETLAKSNVTLSHLFFQQYQYQAQMADLQNGNGLDVPSRKESNCVRCRNHDLRVTLRGHKQYCPYASCTCDKCRFTAEQQRQMRLQNAIRRAEAHERGSTGSGGNIAKRARELSSPPTMVPMQTQPVQQPQQQTPQITTQPQVVTVTVQSAGAAQQVVNGTTG